MLYVLMIGCGVIGVGVMEIFKSDFEVVFDMVVVFEVYMECVCSIVFMLVFVVQVVLCLGEECFDLLIECVGYQVISEYIILVLECGIVCMVVFIGVLFEFGLVDKLEVVVCVGCMQV